MDWAHGIVDYDGQSSKMVLIKTQINATAHLAQVLSWMDYFVEGKNKPKS
jgi:hypothetical protein